MPSPAISPLQSEQEQLPAFSNLDHKDSSSSAEDDVKVEGDVGVVKPPGIIDTFLGRDRQKLQSEPIVWREGAGPFARSVGKRLKGVFTKRFL